MRRQRLLGKGQIAICMRSGIKCKASELVRDGRIPSLLVLPEWADPAHPQERPYVPNDLEGAPRWTPSPDVTPSTPPVLTGEVSEEELANVLAWTAADWAAGPRVEEYVVYRDGAELAVVEVEYSNIGEVENDPLTYTDTDVVADQTYTYFVMARNSLGQTLSSNSVDLTAVEPPVDFGTAMAQTSDTAINGPTFSAPSSWGWGTASFSVEFWHRCDGAVVDVQEQRIIRARGSTGSQSGWEAQVRTSGGQVTRLRLNLRPLSSTMSFNSPALTIPFGEWHHYAITVDWGTNTATFYVDGASVGTANIAAAAGNIGTSGNNRRLMDGIFGAVDELRIWSVVRSPAEIAANYLTPLDSPASEPNLIADWQFNEGSGTDTTEAVEAIVCAFTATNEFQAGPTP